jgi:hypothetical protein
MARESAAGRLTILPSLHPWAFVLGGLGVALLSWLVGVILPGGGPALLRLGLLFAALAVSLTGVGLRLKERRWVLADRIETGAMIAAGGMTSLVAYFSMKADWEAGKMLFGALFIASLAATLLVLLPPLGRKIFLTLFLLFHFGGMLTAVTSIDPPNSTGPWVSKQLWTYVYRPYLSFLYMTNAYHFYSPDPGPPSSYWFSVTYEDGSRTWVKVPNRSTSAVGMQYQRNLALPEHTYSPLGRLPYTKQEIAEMQSRQPDFHAPRGSWEHIYEKRWKGSLRLYLATFEEDGRTVTRPMPIPMVNEQTLNVYAQYREPNDLSKALIASVARRAFVTAPKKYDEGGNEVEVKSVKVYRVTHQILTPRELASGVDPLEKTKHFAYFLGEFDGKGELVDPEDPFLYWYMPILNAPNRCKDLDKFPRASVKDAQGTEFLVPIVVYGLPVKKDAANPDDNTFVLDAVEMHAAGEVRVKKKKGP